MNERYCPKCGRFKALSTPLCDRCIEAEAANKTDDHKCPKCGKHKFPFQPVCYDCKLSQNTNAIQSEIEYAEIEIEELEEIEFEDVSTAEEEPIYTDFDTKYGENNRYKCKCGIFVKSKDERTIADFLYENDIPFQYEPMNDYYAYDVNCNSIVRKEIYPDFFIKGPVMFRGRSIENVYIEYWGMNTPEYLERQATKRQVYKDHNCTLINLYPEDLYDSESSLTMKLLHFKDRNLNY